MTQNMQTDIPKMHMKEGFTIIEVMIALSVGIMITGIFAYMAFQFLESSRRTGTDQTLMQVRAAIEAYSLATGEYPNSLTDLYKEPQGVKNWRKFYPNEPKDGWNQKLFYRRTPDGEHPYELYSYGGGRKGDKGKRISVWSK